MKRSIIFFLLFIIGVSGVYAQTRGNAQAYTLYTEANAKYRDEEWTAAKNKYIELITGYPNSDYVPYALFMLTYLETEYLVIIDYLTLIEENYSDVDFPYWNNAMEKLGDIYYIIGSHSAALDKYQLSQTDKSLYMMSMLYSALGYQEKAVETVNTLLKQTDDYSLAYRAYLVQAKSYIEMYEHDMAILVLKAAIKLKNWAFDDGARLIYYAAKSYFYKEEYKKSLYLFGILRSKFPYAAESTVAKNFLTYLENNNIIVTEQVSWLESYYEERAILPFVTENAGLAFDAELQAEQLVLEGESINGQIVYSEIDEYLVRIGSYQDLGVANLVAVDLSSSDDEYPVGIYFRDGMYYAEIRGVEDIEVAKEYASEIIALGYSNTKVIEVVQVTEYAAQE